MVKEGRKAPAFSLPSSKGGKLALKDLSGKYVVLYFYPRDNTPGCTVEANDFQKASRKFSSRKTVVVGVSKDTIESHCKFAEKQGLKFHLLSDEDAKVMAKYDAWGQKSMYGKKFMGIIRSTVLIGPDGKVIKHWPKVKVKGHVDDVLAALDEARSD